MTITLDSLILFKEYNFSHQNNDITIIDEKYSIGNIDLGKVISLNSSFVGMSIEDINLAIEQFLSFDSFVVPYNIGDIVVEQNLTDIFLNSNLLSFSIGDILVENVDKNIILDSIEIIPILNNINIDGENDSINLNSTEIIYNIGDITLFLNEGDLDLDSLLIPTNINNLSIEPINSIEVDSLSIPVHISSLGNFLNTKKLPLYDFQIPIEIGSLSFDDSIFDIKVKDPPSGHIPLFAIGDILRMKGLSNDGTDILDNWLEVVGLTDPGADTGFYIYHVTRRSGSSGIFPKGTAIVNYGANTGDGFILLTSDMPNSPYIDIATHDGSPWNDVTPRIRLGQLDGLANINDEWGLAAGTDLSSTDVNSPKLLASSGGVRLFNIDLELYKSGLQTVELTNEGNLKLGKNLSNTSAFDFNTTTGNLLIGSILDENYLLWNDSNGTLTIAGNLILSYNNIDDLPSSLEDINEDEYTKLSISGNSGGRIFTESWDQPHTHRWDFVSDGQGEKYRVTTQFASVGGKYLVLGNNSGNDEVWMILKERFPFDPNRIYKVTTRMRRTHGNGTAYLGFTGFDENDNYVNIHGSDSVGSQHYGLINYAFPNGNNLWEEHIYYVHGKASVGNQRNNTTISHPLLMHEDVKYFSPLILANYNNAAGSVQVDYLLIEDVTNEIIPRFPTTENLLLHYNFDEGNGNVLYDKSTYKREENPIGTFNWDGNGINGRCIDFVSGGVNLLTDAEMDTIVSSGFTISVWFNSKTTTGYPNARIVSRNSSAHFSIQLDQNMSSGSQLLKITDRRLADVTFILDENIETNKWYNVVYVYNENNRNKVYLNGEKVLDELIENSLNSTTAILALGTHSTTSIVNTNRFVGKFDELRVYGEPVTIEEAKALYRNITGDVPIHRTLEAPNGDGLFLSPTEMGFYDNGTWKTYMDNLGNFYLGGSGGTLQFTESTGDLLLGNVSGANIYWDQSEGKLLFRNITTTELSLDSDGSLYAGGNKVRLDSDGLSFPNVTESETTSAGQITWTRPSVNTNAYMYTEISLNPLVESTLRIGISKGADSVPTAITIDSDDFLTLNSDKISIGSTSIDDINMRAGNEISILSLSEIRLDAPEIWLNSSGNRKLRVNGTNLEYYNGTTWQQLN